MNNTDKNLEEMKAELALLRAQNAHLKNQIESLEAENARSYKGLFNICPVAISENNFSRVKEYFDSLKLAGVSNIGHYLHTHPNKRQEVFKLMQMVELVDLNEAHFQIHNVRKEEYLALIPVIFEMYGPEQVDEYANQFAALADGQTSYEQEMPPLQTIDGSVRHMISYLRVAPGYENDLSKVFVVYIDFTEKKLAEVALRASEQALRKSNIEKERFISIMAHDLRGPFNSILGFINLLKENVRKYETNVIESQVNIIHMSAHKVFNILEDVLMWIRSQSGQLPMEPMELDMADVCEKIINDLSQYAASKNLSLSYFEDSKVSVYADVNMIKTVMRNLISNAIKFTESNGKIIVYSMVNHTHATITVSDTGIGMDEKTVAKLFNSSEVFSTPGTANEKGTGLGLTLCKEFVEKNGGKIRVESKPGVGTSFIFDVPLFKHSSMQ